MATKHIKKVFKKISPREKKFESSEAEVRYYLKKISRQYRFRSIILRGLLTGISVTIGATIGFAFIIIVISRLLSSLSFIPIVDDILRETQLDVLIESEVNKISGIEPEEEDANNTTEYLTYTNEALSLSFIYPQQLSISESTIGDSTMLTLTGKSALEKMEIYVNHAVDINEDDAEKVRIENPEIDEDEFLMFRDGTSISNEFIDSPIYTLTYEKELNKYIFIGYGDTLQPSQGRQIFKNILESLK